MGKLPYPEPENIAVAPTDDSQATVRPGGEPPSAVPSETLFIPVGVAVPQQIGQYTLKRIIGSGSFGTVYEAIQERPHRPVALKVMRRASATPSPSSLRRFQFEAELLGRLHHPGIAQVYDAGMFDDGMGGTPYFVLEYIPNAKTITQYAMDHELSIRQRLELFARVCDAVYQPNLQGIIHRDLKPANILVDAAGQPKVIDFGVARATDSDMVVASQQTNIGELVGTLAYMSPEQIDADPHDIDIRSDVYSLGVVLFELLTGQLPHDVAGLPSYRAARIIREQPPKRLSSIKPELGGDIETIVNTAMRKERQWRYQNTGELRDNIERFLHHQPIIVRSPSLSAILRTHARAFISRHPWWSYAAVIAVVGLLTELIGAPLVYRWTSLNDWFVHMQRSMLTPAPQNTPFEHVRVVGFSDQTLDHLSELGQTHGLPEMDFINLSKRPSVRPLHGLLMERLAHAGIRGLVSDVGFPTQSQYDGALIHGVKALRDAGIPIVETMLFDEGHATICPDLAPLVQPGWPGARPGDSHVDLEMFVKCENGLETIPCLAVGGYAAVRHPKDRFATQHNPDLGILQLYYFGPDESLPQLRRFDLKNTDVLPCSIIETYDPAEHSDDEPSGGLSKGDTVGLHPVDLPTDHALAASTIDYEWVLSADDKQLREALQGMVVVLGYTTSVGEEPSKVGKDREIFGVYFHAAGLESLLAGETKKPETRSAARTALGLSCVFGAAITVQPWRRSKPRFTKRMPDWRKVGVGTVVIILLALVVSAIAYARFDYVFNPCVPLIGLLAAYLATRGVASIHCQPLD